MLGNIKVFIWLREGTTYNMDKDTVGGVYAIFATKTGECLYVGATRDFSVRWRQHKSKLKLAKHPAPGFSEWYESEGCRDPSSIRFEALEEENDPDCRAALEAKWFDRLLPRFFGIIPVGSEADAESLRAFYERRQAVLPEQKKRMSAAQLERYSQEEGRTYVGDKEVVGLAAGVQYTTLPIEERICEDCGAAFYVVASYSRRQCQRCWETNPLRGEQLHYDVSNPDRQKVGTLSDLTEDVLRHEYLDLGLSTVEISKRYGTSDVTVINRAKRWGVPLRKRSEGLSIAGQKRRDLIAESIDLERFTVLWGLGVSAKVIQEVMGIGVKTYQRFVAEHALTRPDVRKRSEYPCFDDETERRLSDAGFPPDAIGLVASDLARYGRIR